MRSVLRPRTPVLFIGDILFFVSALWLTLFVRFSAFPSMEVFKTHLLPFAILFVIWIIIFFIAGLYEQRILLFTRELPRVLFNTQTINVALAALFFFLIPYFGITPKTILFIYLFMSFLLIMLWRLKIFPLFGIERAEGAVIVGEGKEAEELASEISKDTGASVRISEIIKPSECGDRLGDCIDKAVAKGKPAVLILDIEHTALSPILPSLYKHLFSGVRFIDMTHAYEEVFERIPLSLIGGDWIAKNVSRYAHRLYDVLKRLLDILIGSAGFLLSLPLYPCIALAIKVQDGGPVFIEQERVGERGRRIRMKKFRSMTGNDKGVYGAAGTDLRVTSVGRFLRTTRLDELPQLTAVVRGELSLIGPRPEFPSLTARYEKEIPYYAVRYLIKPGLSGWAQLYHDNHPHHIANVEATREKLAYDLYYLKHRSFMLDLVIGIKTIRKIIMQSGS